MHGVLLPRRAHSLPDFRNSVLRKWQLNHTRAMLRTKTTLGDVLQRFPPLQGNAGFPLHFPRFSRFPPSFCIFSGSSTDPRRRENWPPSLQRGTTPRRPRGKNNVGFHASGIGSCHRLSGVIIDVRMRVVVRTYNVVTTRTRRQKTPSRKSNRIDRIAIICCPSHPNIQIRWHSKRECFSEYSPPIDPIRKNERNKETTSIVHADDSHRGYHHTVHLLVHHLKLLLLLLLSTDDARLAPQPRRPRQP